MTIITATQLRTNQRKYLKMAENEPVYVTRRGGQPLLITTADDDDDLTPKELESIRRGLEDIKAGRTKTMIPGESLDQFLDRVCTE